MPAASQHPSARPAAQAAGIRRAGRRQAIASGRRIGDDGRGADDGSCAFKACRSRTTEHARPAVAGAASRSGGAKADRLTDWREAFGQRRLTGARLEAHCLQLGIPFLSCFTSPVREAKGHARFGTTRLTP